MHHASKGRGLRMFSAAASLLLSFVVLSGGMAAHAQSADDEKKIDSLILGWVRIAPGGNNDGFERLARRIE